MNTPNRQRGSALVLAMLLVVVLVATTHTVVQGARRTATDSVLDMGRARALCAADAGVELARLRLSRDVAWSGSVESIDGVTTIVGVTRREDGAFAIQVGAACTVGGTTGTVRAAVEAVLRAQERALPAIEAWRCR